MARKNRATLVFDGRDNTDPLFNALDSKLKRAESSFFSLKTGITAVTGIVAGAWFKSTVDAGDNIAKLTQQINVNAEALSEYAHIAESANISTEQLTTAWEKQQIRIAQAAQGAGAAKDVLIELGLSAEALNKIPVDQQFEAIAEALSQVQNSGDRSRIAMQLWEEAGTDLIRITGQGAAGLEAMRQEASRLGATLTQEQAEAMAEINQSFTDLDTALTGAANQAVVVFGPAIVTVMNLLSDSLPQAVKIGAESFNWLGNAIEQMFIADFRNIAEVSGNLAKLIKIGPLQEWFQDIARSAGLAADRIEHFGLNGGLALGEPNRKVFELKENVKDLNEELSNTQFMDFSPMESHVAAYEEREKQLADIDKQRKQRLAEIQRWRWNVVRQNRAANQQEVEDTKAANQAKIAASQSFFGSMTALMAASGNKNWKLYQAFMIAEAGAAAIAGATKAAEVAASGGPWAAFAAYASVFAKLSLAAVQIKNLRPGSTATGGIGGGGTVSNAPPTTAPRTSDTGAGQGASGQDSRQFVIISTVGDPEFISEAFVDRVMEIASRKINEGSAVYIRRGTPQALEIQA